MLLNTFKGQLKIRNDNILIFLQFLSLWLAVTMGMTLWIFKQQRVITMNIKFAEIIYITRNNSQTR